MAMHRWKSTYNGYKENDKAYAKWILRLFTEGPRIFLHSFFYHQWPRFSQRQGEELKSHVTNLMNVLWESSSLISATYIAAVTSLTVTPYNMQCNWHVFWIPMPQEQNYLTILFSVSLREQHIPIANLGSNYLWFSSSHEGKSFSEMFNSTPFLTLTTWGQLNSNEFVL